MFRGLGAYGCLFECVNVNDKRLFWARDSISLIVIHLRCVIS